MTGLERVLTALGRGEPDRVPVWELIVNEPVIHELYGDVSYWDFVERLDLDGLTIFEDQRVVAWINQDTYRDEWGIVWKIAPNGIAYPSGGPIREERDLDRYAPPDPDADHRLRSLEAAAKRFKGEKALVFLGHETFEFCHYLLGGMDKLFLNYVLNPAFVDRLSEMIWTYKSRVLARAAEVGADILLTGDDYASRNGTLMSPTHFERFVLPYLTRAVAVAHAHKRPFIKHTDGNLWKVMDMLVGTGLNGLDPIEPMAGMDIGAVKAQYGDRIAVIGNVDCTEILPHGSRQDVVDAVKETLAKASVGGGHILASSNSIHPGVNPENYRTMVQAAREFGVYPLDPKMVETYRTQDYMAKWVHET
ncbi:MAG: uroporphyrinogen decarboxylase family protein [Candidatus Latescibacterota bacterium]